MINFKFEITEIKEDVIATSTLSTTHYAKSEYGNYFAVIYNTTTCGWETGPEISETSDPELYNLLIQANMKVTEFKNQVLDYSSGLIEADIYNLYYINDQGKVVECTKNHHMIDEGQ